MKTTALLRAAVAFLPAVAATAFAFAVTSCGPAETSSTPPPNPSAPKASKVLRLYSWSEYFEPEILAAFEEETGIRVEYSTFSNTDEMKAILRSKPGHYDVIVADDSVLEEMWDLRLIGRFDKEKLPNLANIEERYLNLPFDPGNKFSAPYMWGTTLVAYRNDKITDPRKSWDLLWDEKLRGKVMMIGERFEVLSLALMVSGYSINSENPDEIRHAGDKALEQITKVEVRYGDDAEVREGLDQGTVWAAMCYSGDAAMVAAENENVSFFIPQEGAPLWIDSFAITRDSMLSDEAHRFVNFMLGAEAAAANSNYTYYASPNRAAVPFLDEDLLEDESIYPREEVLDRCAFWNKMTGQREHFMNQAWLTIQKRMQKREISGGPEEETKLRKETAQATP